MCPGLLYCASGTPIDISLALLANALLLKLLLKVFLAVMSKSLDGIDARVTLFSSLCTRWAGLKARPHSFK